MHIHTAQNRFFYRIMCAALLLTTSLTVASETRYKPFILAQDNMPGDSTQIIKSVRAKLERNGFQLIGQYSPYQGSTILIITNDALRQHATQSAFGSFGAILRVTLTKADHGTQLAYTNPIYMAHAYQMKTDLSDISKKITVALGQQREYGSAQGLTKAQLRDYQYKWLMPYFYDRHELASYKDHQTAVAAVEENLNKKVGGVAKVYRVDIPDKEETIIGVHMTGPADNECSGDRYLMDKIDFKKIKSTGHLPYEVVISKGKVYSLYAEFRIAINFPDLSMMGSNSFASIMCAPDAIESALRAAAGGKNNL